MVKSVFSLLVVLAVAGEPVAWEVCQIVCSSTSAHPMLAVDSHHGHHHAVKADGSCHEAAGPTRHVSPQSPACDHHGEATAPSVVAEHSADAVLLRAAPVPRVDEVVFVCRLTFVPTQQSALPDRLETRSARPLRI